VEFSTGELFAVSFGLWAGVVGLSVRHVVAMLADMDKRMRCAEKKIAILERDKFPQ